MDRVELMASTRRNVALLSLALALVACQPTEPTSLDPPPAPASDTKPSAHTPSLSTAVPEPAPPPRVIDDPSASGPELLHLVAHREGPMTLIEALDKPYLLLEGEPVPIDPQRGPIRDPSLGAGLYLAHRLGKYDPQLRFGLEGVLAGDLADQAWLAHELFEDRASTVPMSYARDDGRWSGLDAPGDPLITYFIALVGWSDTVVALRAYQPRSSVYWSPVDDDDPDARRERERERELAQQALEKVESGFVRLRGSGSFVEPKLPRDVGLDDVVPLSAVATPDGTIYAVIRLYPDEEPEDEFDLHESDRQGLLVWSPGKAKPKRVELPGFDERHHGYGLDLHLSGDYVLADVHADEGMPYLALGRGTTWEQVPIELPPGETSRQAIVSAARSSSGELWVVLAPGSSSGVTLTHALWHKPPQGKWARVHVPALEFSPAYATPRWAFEWERREWQQIPRALPERPPEPMKVIWAGGAIWVTAELGMVFGGDPTYELDIVRTALFSTQAIATGPVELAPIDRVVLDQDAQRSDLARLQAGEHGCRSFVLTLGDEQQVERVERVERVASFSDDVLAELRAGRPADDGGALGLMYVGELGNERELVVAATAMDSVAAERLRARVEALIGGSVGADCRIPAMVRPIANLAPTP